MYNTVSLLVLQSSCWRKERSGCFTLIVFLISFGIKCSASLPYSAAGLSAVWHFRDTLLYVIHRYNHPTN